MNIVKSMEAIVIAAVAMTFVTAVATASAPAPRKGAAVADSPATSPAASPAGQANANHDVMTIVVTGKRLTAEQKANVEG